MSNFTTEQVQALGKKLHRRHVQTRKIEGRTIDYIEGWFAIAEANAIFGYAGWDRETMHLERLYERTRGETTSCGYLARVRVRVRAGDTFVVREGTGWGHVSANALGDAHERAAKTAETDAMKRALATFGNRFGLGLYDKEQNGVTGKKSENVRNKPSGAGAFLLYAPDGTLLAEQLASESFCSGLRQLIDKCQSAQEFARLHDSNKPSITRLRVESPTLTNAKGIHYADILEQLISHRLGKFGNSAADGGAAPPELALAPSKIAPGPRIDKSTLTIGTVRLIRDKAHLQFVASHPCLVCDQKQTQAHHLKFAQKRGLSQKVSDEFSVPLCVSHHAELHRASSEQNWWRDRGVEPLFIAASLWAQSHVRNSRFVSVTAEESPVPIATAERQSDPSATIAGGS